ncbi:hypothetical protein N8459_03855 [Nitrosopumilus sp.]|nr:hypothetical protein [Nitrosopumilus sp.]
MLKLCTHPEWTNVLEGHCLLQAISKSYELYMAHGSRSSKKVDYFHSFIKKELEVLILTLLNNSNCIYVVKLEQNIKSCNSSHKKKCDVVIYKNNNPYIIFPVKLIMTNFKQNKNNAWENLTGELTHLKWSNPDIIIIPINIIMNKTPYLTKQGIIKKIEHISHNDIKQYDLLVTHKLVYTNINYIINVTHNNLSIPLIKNDNTFKHIPQIIGFNIHTPHNSLTQLVYPLLI